MSTGIRSAMAPGALAAQELKETLAKIKGEKPAKRKKATSNISLGKRGEDAACTMLFRKGYEIIARNWKCNFGEADIIVRDENTLIFVEVKTRSGLSKGFPSEAVSAEKRKKYEKIALAYLSNNSIDDMSVRFDIVAIVVLENDRALLRHHINAFSAA